MTHTPAPRSTDPSPDAPAVEVDVARTGGIAGLTRRWSAQPAGDEASEWIPLIEGCPWDEAGPVDPDADPRREPVPDGFVWVIRAVWSGTDPRRAELPDDELVGAWRDLVDAVRDWNAHDAGERHPAR